MDKIVGTLAQIKPLDRIINVRSSSAVMNCVFVVRVLAGAAFLVSGTWAAFYHHQDASVLIDLTIAVPFLIYAVTSAAIMRAAPQS